MVHLFDTNLTSEQVDAILARIVESSDSDLNLTTLSTYLENFSLLSPAVLSKALVRLEAVDLEAVELSQDQVTAILVEVGESQNLRLNILLLPDIDFACLPPEVLAKAVVRLEKFDLGHVSFIDPWNFILLKGIDDL